MEKQRNVSKSNIIYIIIAIVVIIIFINIVNSHTSSSSSKSHICQSCHKTFTNKDDVSSIIWTNMCEKCYNNYKFTQDLKEELKKYEENK